MFVVLDINVFLCWIRGSGCNTLSHSGLANVNIRKRMLYRHCYIPSFQAQAVQIILFNCMQKCPP